MATRAEIIARFQRLPAFKGLVKDDIDVYLDLALEAIAGYAPKRVKLKGIPGGQSGSRYDVPPDAKTVLGAYVTDTNIKIEMREENARRPNVDAEGRHLDANGDIAEISGNPVVYTVKREYLLLQIEVPSWINEVREGGLGGGYQEYPSRFAQGFRYGRFAGAGDETHDLDYTVGLTVEDLDERQLMAMRLYAEGEAYQYQSTRSTSLSDITDRDATGESTTIRRSQSGSSHQTLAERRQMEFKREIARPYWSVDTFGLTQYLWEEQRM